MEISALLRSAAPNLRSGPQPKSPLSEVAPPALPNDEVTLSVPAHSVRPAPSLSHLAMLGLSALGTLGGLVANVSADTHIPDQVQVAAAKPAPARPASLTEMMTPSDQPEGWMLALKSPPAPIPVQVKALSTPVFQKGDYLKHGVNFSNLVSNAEFTDVTSTRPQDLQAYLEDIDSWLATTPVDGDRMAAEVIMATAKSHNVNPWALLATLEKETSLVTRTAPPSHKTLRKSMGFAYNDGGSKAGKKSNFLYQLDKGAELLKNLYQEGQQLTFPRQMKVNYGHKTITVRNAATYALMRYTPHTTDTKLSRVGGGNYLFRKHMERMVNTFLDNAPQPTLLAAD